nr:ribosomal large subunit pseudouridine synthase B-like [Equus asinus]
MAAEQRELGRRRATAAGPAARPGLWGRRPCARAAACARALQPGPWASGRAGPSLGPAEEPRREAAARRTLHAAPRGLGAFSGPAWLPGLGAARPGSRFPPLPRPGVPLRAEAAPEAQGGGGGAHGRGRAGRPRGQLCPRGRRPPALGNDRPSSASAATGREVPYPCSLLCLDSSSLALSGSIAPENKPPEHSCQGRFKEFRNKGCLFSSWPEVEVVIWICFAYTGNDCTVREMNFKA